MKRIDYYKTNDGKCPFKEWLSSLSIEYQMRIRKRLDRIYEGNFGDWGIYKTVNSVKCVFSLVKVTEFIIKNLMMLLFLLLQEVINLIKIK